MTKKRDGSSLAEGIKLELLKTEEVAVGGMRLARFVAYASVVWEGTSVVTVTGNAKGYDAPKRRKFSSEAAARAFAETFVQEAEAGGLERPTGRGRKNAAKAKAEPKPEPIEFEAKGWSRVLLTPFGVSDSGRFFRAGRMVFANGTRYLTARHLDEFKLAEWTADRLNVSECPVRGLSCTYADERTLTVGGERGVLRSRTHDGTWQKVKIDTRAFLYVMERIRDVFWLAGAGGFIARAPSPVGPWSIVRPSDKGTTDGIYAIVANADRIFFVGHRTFYWENNKLHTMKNLPPLYSGVALDDTLILGGPAGSLLRSEDGGRTFAHSTIGNADIESLMAWNGVVYAATSKQGAYASKGTVLRSTNGGRTFEVILNDAGALFQITTDGQRLYFCGDGTIGSMPSAKPGVSPKNAPTEAELFELAKRGKVDALMNTFRLEDDDSDRLAYKWLSAAEDFGFDASAEIRHLLELSNLRYDDEHFETASAHWELATAYLEGGAGLPCNLKLAKNHLDKALAVYSLETLTKGTNRKYPVKLLVERLSGEAKSLLTEMLSGEHRSVTPRAAAPRKSPKARAKK